MFVSQADAGRLGGTILHKDLGNILWQNILTRSLVARLLSSRMQLSNLEFALMTIAIAMIINAHPTKFDT